MSNNVGLKMLADGVLIKPGDESENSYGIVLPDSAKQKPTIGKVVAVGPGNRNTNGDFDKLTVKVGDTVFYKKWAGSEIKHHDVEYIVMKESDIIAIQEGK
jgi:chaperonin GroES